MKFFFMALGVIASIGMIVLIVRKPTHHVAVTATAQAPIASNAVAQKISELAAKQIAPPTIDLQNLKGGQITLDGYKDKKAVIVDFWASWCPNCRRDLPHLNSYYEKYQDNLEVIGINLQEDEGVVRAFTAQQHLSFPVALDPEAEAAQAFGARYTNTHFLINKKGFLVGVIPGDIEEADVQALIQSS